MKWLFLLPVIILFALLTSCDERYRYPCQDPENWENKICKKPYCSASGTCPEDLKHYEKDKNKSPVPDRVPQNLCQACPTGVKK